ncbi:hypothetical protein ACFLWK_01365 [Chloroflexota bacterium]
MENNTLAHLETLRQDARDEIKRRIEQRNKYSIQMTIALGALVAVSFSSRFSPDLRAVLIAMPLVSIYYTVLILYSYRIHHVLAKYLRDKIEPKLALGYGIEQNTEWEIYYEQQEVPGIRRWFFLVALWAVTIFTLGSFWAEENLRAALGDALLVMTIVYGTLVFFITLWDLNIKILLKRKKR